MSLRHLSRLTYALVVRRHTYWGGVDTYLLVLNIYISPHNSSMRPTCICTRAQYVYRLATQICLYTRWIHKSTRVQYIYMCVSPDNLSTRATSICTSAQDTDLLAFDTHTSSLNIYISTRAQHIHLSSPLMYALNICISTRASHIYLNIYIYLLVLLKYICNWNVRMYVLAEYIYMYSLNMHDYSRSIYVYLSAQLIDAPTKHTPPHIKHKRISVATPYQAPAYTSVYKYTLVLDMGWLQLVGSLKL